MIDGKPKLVVIAGPTASGKSSLATEMAVCFGGEIVNADSMQVYRGMDVGTAKPSIIERRGVPHHLFDVVDPDEDFNAAIFRSLAIPIIKDLRERNKKCFIVGGTGLYIKSLLGGLIYCPPSDSVYRGKLQKQAEKKGTAALHKRLAELDPESACKIHPNDKVRIIRALEIIHLTKKTLSSLTLDHGFQNMAFEALKISLQTSRERLYHRINERCLIMMRRGLVKETKDLLDNGYPSNIKPMKAIGYRHVIQLLKGNWDLNETVNQFQRDTRRYAKRQLTWFRMDPGIRWFDVENGKRDEIIHEVEKFL